MGPEAEPARAALLETATALLCMGEKTLPILPEVRKAEKRKVKYASRMLRHVLETR